MSHDLNVVCQSKSFEYFLSRSRQLADESESRVAASSACDFLDRCSFNGMSADAALRSERKDVFECDEHGRIRKVS